VSGPRRSTAGSVDSSLNYASIGATQNPDIVVYPPQGFTPFEESRKIGSGDERFEIASRMLMTWGVHRNIGIPVTDIARDESIAYRGIELDEGGRPLGPAGEAPEELFAPDGTPYVTAGMTATIKMSIGPVKVDAPVKVVYVIDEPDRVGFAYGSRHGHPARSEQLLLVQKEKDGSVWLTIRSISAPTSAKWSPTVVLMRRVQRTYLRKFLTALHPSRATGA
jgi:uncharacterized protein (UPF0548 family)